MSRIGGRLSVRKRPLMNLQYFRTHPLRIISRMILRNNTTMLEAMMTSVITEISSARGYKNSTSSNSDEVIHGLELISQHSKRAKNYTK
jgi:hypothetical protein